MFARTESFHRTRVCTAMLIIRALRAPCELARKRGTESDREREREGAHTHVSFLRRPNPVGFCDTRADLCTRARSRGFLRQAGSGGVAARCLTRPANRKSDFSREAPLKAV